MKLPTNKSRRYFLRQLGFVSGAVVLPFPLISNYSNNGIVLGKPAPLKFGMMADVHADLIPDKMERLEKFVQESIAKELDFIVQLGDFCFPKKENEDFLHLWNQFEGPKYHLLGNHDMDVSSKEVIMDFWEMPEKYYSFDQKGIHFVVLDPNYLYIDHEYREYDNANFYVDDRLRTYINPRQIEWLKDDLEKTDLHAIILSHQSLINPSWGIKNRTQIQEILENENQRAGYQKVIACFNGHDHIDYQRTLNGIHYVEVNSMSYQWLGEKYSDQSRYPASFYEEYQHLDKLANYKDSLFAFVEVDTINGWIKVEGVQSEWLAPSPSDLGVPDREDGIQYSAEISDRNLLLDK